MEPVEIYFPVATEAMISLQSKGVFKAVYRTGRQLIAVTVPVIPAIGYASNRRAFSRIAINFVIAATDVILTSWRERICTTTFPHFFAHPDVL